MLAKKRCVPCEGGTKPLSRKEASKYLREVPKWRLTGDKAILRNFLFKDFKGSMKFVSAVAKVAEHEGHHPDISISWNKVRLTLFTHAIGGLSENDFIVAAKVDRLKEAEAGRR